MVTCKKQQYCHTNFRASSKQLSSKTFWNSGNLEWWQFSLLTSVSPCVNCKAIWSTRSFKVYLASLAKPDLHKVQVTYCVQRRGEAAYDIVGELFYRKMIKRTDGTTCMQQALTSAEIMPKFTSTKLTLSYGTCSNPYNGLYSADSYGKVADAVWSTVQP